MEDNKSIGLCFSTFVLAAIHSVAANNILVWVTITAGVTTIVYNVLKISREIRK